MFASTGEKLTDFDAFHPDRMASRILDMGDMLTFIEQAEKAFDAEQAAKDAEKIMGGSFTLHDFLKQMEAMAKMGSMSKIMGMLPGMGQYKEQLESFDEREVDRIKAIILSMTPAERDDPKMIDGSRRARIAKGSGTEVRDVNGLVDRFFEARKMMQQMAKGGGMPGMPGMGGMPGMPGVSKRAGARQKPQGKKKGKRGSGNPAKRAAEEKAAAARQSGGAGGAGAFGLGQDDEAEFELPKELRDLM
jgi:signal recognition particle subunit SRP54